jgi:hypothetical protein
MKVVAKVLDYRKDRQLWDEVRAIAERKYGRHRPILIAMLVHRLCTARCV